ncbi:MAG: hypothetical protein ACXWUL_09585 [Caldimonas sp.]
MKNRLVLGAVAAAVAVFSQGAFAQTTDAPKARADVKAEARTGALAPAGQGPMASAPSKTSDKTRDERKATTKADRSAGALKPAGEAVKPAGAAGKDDKADKVTGSMTTRDERKATTRAAVKSGQTQPAGEAPQPSAEKPKK